MKYFCGKHARQNLVQPGASPQRPLSGMVIVLKPRKEPRKNMTVTIDLPQETERKLQELAARNGKDVVGFVSLLIERVVETNGVELAESSSASDASRAVVTLDEILAPVRAEFESSGMSEEELTNFLTEVRDEARNERRARQAS
jgi:predicted DNA-binding protein